MKTKQKFIFILFVIYNVKDKNVENVMKNSWQ